MRKLSIATAAAILSLGAVALLAAPSFSAGAAGTETTGTESAGAPLQLAHMSQGQMDGSGMGMGMMHPHMSGHMSGHGSGMGMGMMSGCPGLGGPATAALELSADDVRGRLEGMLTWHGNDRLKLGEVSEIDDDTVRAEIVTVDGSLVERLEVNRHTGQMQRLN